MKSIPCGKKAWYLFIFFLSLLLLFAIFIYYNMEYTQRNIETTLGCTMHSFISIQHWFCWKSKTKKKQNQKVYGTKGQDNFRFKYWFKTILLHMFSDTVHYYTFSFAIIWTLRIFQFQIDNLLMCFYSNVWCSVHTDNYWCGPIFLIIFHDHKMRFMFWNITKI